MAARDTLCPLIQGSGGSRRCKRKASARNSQAKGLQPDKSLDRRIKALGISGYLKPGTCWTGNPPIAEIGGFSVFQEIECLTNNHALLGFSSRVTLVGGGPVGVLTLARDRLHSGWSLLTHPLYGNIQPFQQPFRSILVGLSEEHACPDPDSLILLEKAIGLFSRAGSGSASCRMNPESMDDYASLDVYLMRDSMEKYGLWRKILKGGE